MKINLKTIAACFLAGMAMSANVFAASGSTNITAAADPAGSDFGYYDGCCGGTPYGSALTPVLSDGRVIAFFGNFPAQPALPLILSISGFTSDPGPSYLHKVTATCASLPTSFLTSSASYAYNSSLGTATWSWSRTNVCMKLPGTAYHLAVS